MVRDRDSGLVGVEGDGGGNVGEGVRGKNNGLRWVWEWAPARVGAGGTAKGCIRVQARREQGKSTNGGGVALNKVNVSMCECNVATFQRGKYPTLRR